MDCRRCENIRYDGCRYGRCSCSGHEDVRLSPGKDGKRPYSRSICPDFVLKRRCSNCRYWIRGEYFADGRTPARKGRCSLDFVKAGSSCGLWRKGTTSWRKRK